MIVQLTGTLIEVQPNSVILDVAGVGYELQVSSKTAANLPPVGEAGITLLCRLIVRADAHLLFGFESREERALFDKLTAISGVGPKAALSILSSFSPRDLSGLVLANNLKALTQVPGIGKKTAARLMLELSGLFSADPDLNKLLSSSKLSSQTSSAKNLRSPEHEAKEALLSMGFTTREIDLAFADTEDIERLSTEDLLALALRRLGR